MNLLELAKQYNGLTEMHDHKTLNNLLKKYVPKWNYDVRTTPWCAAFTNMLCAKANLDTTNSFVARSFLKWGKKTSLDEAKPGDIMIFRRGSSSWQGHVAIYTGKQDDLSVEVIGGNQDNKVCTKAYDKSRLLGIRRAV